jgi:GNAT acetyltransferase
MIYSDLELIQMQAQALFVHDKNGRLLRINERNNLNPAARFFLSRSKSGNLWRTRFDLSPDLSAELERLAAAEPVASDLAEPPRYTAEYARLLQEHAPIISTGAGPGYYLPSNQPHDGVMITSENLALLEAHFDWLLTTLADYAPVVAAVVDGKAVAVCFCSRITPTVAEAGLHTDERYRGHGYATKAARGWVTAVCATGRQPLYSTSWTNLASQAIARKLDGVLYGADYTIT